MAAGDGVGSGADVSQKPEVHRPEGGAASRGGPLPFDQSGRAALEEGREHVAGVRRRKHDPPELVRGVAPVGQVEEDDAERYHGVAQEVGRLETRREASAPVHTRGDPPDVGKPALLHLQEQGLEPRVATPEELPGLPVDHQEKERRDQVANDSHRRERPEKREDRRGEDSGEPDGDRPRPPRTLPGSHNGPDDEQGEEGEAD